MDELDADDVMRAAAAWIWVPDDAEKVANDDYLLVAFPAHFASPTQVLRTTSERPPAELVAEVVEHVRRWERPSVAWWCSPVTRPTDLEHHLVAAGAERDETLTVLARPIGDAEPSPSPFEVRSALDADTVRDHERIGVATFGGAMPDEDWVEREVVRLRARHESGTALSVVAYRDGEPVGIGGVTVADGYGRLWSGGTVEAARGQGVYAAVTAARAAWASEHGARGLLTKGRVDTSAPILRRAGFTAYGEERSYLVRVE